MCGIFAIFSSTENKNIGNDIVEGLKRLQHRGKDGYGIAYHACGRFHMIKKEGRVNMDVLPIESRCCVGHNRYSTSGYTVENGIIVENELQPLKGTVKTETYYLVHNGNIPSADGHDTSRLVELIDSLQYMDIEDILTFIVRAIPAAFCLILLFEDRVYVVRDRYGIRPMCLGQHNDSYYVSSETHGLGDASFIRDVKPGEIIRIDYQGIKSIFLHPESQLSLCTFEILYFANENSVIDGYSVKEIRKGLAIKLAEREYLIDKDYVVVGVPSTGSLLGQTYADIAGLRYGQWITKNPNVDRTFILKTDRERKEACMRKFFYDIPNLRGSKVILVDDTIVRGNVISAVIENLRKIGVNEIHVRIPAPPVVDRCILGISIQDRNELIFTNKTIEEVCQEIGADTLSYLSLDDVAEFVPPRSYNLCFSGHVDKDILSCPREIMKESGFNSNNVPPLFLEH